MFEQESFLLVPPFEDLCLEFVQEAHCSSKKLTVTCMHITTKVLY